MGDRRISGAYWSTRLTRIEQDPVSLRDIAPREKVELQKQDSVLPLHMQTSCAHMQGTQRDQKQEKEGREGGSYENRLLKSYNPNPKVKFSCGIMGLIL